MSETKSFSMTSHQPGPKHNHVLSILGWLGGSILLVAVFLVTTLLMQTPAGSSVTSFLSWLFAADSVQVMWFITRAAGFTSYLLIWLSVAWGLAVSNKILDQLLHRQITYDFHQFISLLAIGFLFLHIGVLLFDRYLPYSIYSDIRTLPFSLPPALGRHRGDWLLPDSFGDLYILCPRANWYESFPLNPCTQPGSLFRSHHPRVFLRHQLIPDLRTGLICRNLSRNGVPDGVLVNLFN